VSEHARHDLDELSELLDGRLPEARRREVVERLRECAECRDAQASLQWVKGQAQRLASAEAPAGLEAAVQAALRPAGGGKVAMMEAPTRWARWRRHRPAVAAAAAAALIIGLAFVLSRLGPPNHSPLPEAVAQDVGSRAEGRLELVIEASDARRLELFLGDQRLGFETRVLDLAMMGFDLVGGGATPLAGRPSALMVYRETATGLEILCRMLRESLAALPPPHETRQHDGIPFQVYHQGDVTVVFWPEGPVLCALAGRGEPEALVQLAFGKAMKATRQTNMRTSERVRTMLGT
jgi:anti-sigma factor RsiW